MPAAHAPRKQARQDRARHTQEAISEAAARILETGGRDAVTTNAIAQRAGVSIGSLYQYFPNKEAVLAEVIRRKRRDILARMQAASAAPAPDREAQMLALLRAGLAHQIDRPRLSAEVEYLERHLGLDAETRALSDAMAVLVLDTVRLYQPAAGPQEAGDVIAICKGLISAAAQAGRPDGAVLFPRIRRAVLGYLTQSPGDGSPAR